MYICFLCKCCACTKYPEMTQFGLQANSLFPYTFKSFTSVPSQFLTQNYQLFCFIFKAIFYNPLKIFYCRKYNNSRLTTWLSTIRQLLQQDFCSFAGIAFTFTFRFSSQSKKYQFIQKLHIQASLKKHHTKESISNIKLKFVISFKKALVFM